MFDVMQQPPAGEKMQSALKGKISLGEDEWDLEAFDAIRFQNRKIPFFVVFFSHCEEEVVALLFRP